jgi:hypothetical protein
MENDRGQTHTIQIKSNVLAVFLDGKFANFDRFHGRRGLFMI